MQLLAAFFTTQKKTVREDALNHLPVRRSDWPTALDYSLVLSAVSSSERQYSANAATANDSGRLTDMWGPGWRSDRELVRHHNVRPRFMYQPIRPTRI